ncbi:MAG: gliding motility-associated C-terminal domain-containing protein [Chitinophagaceae bacterium]|nr:gliding motility-associated C-terminal domain-containing protein [Chitinophagaceae bacterium]
MKGYPTGKFWTTIALCFLSYTCISQVNLTSGLVAHYPFNGNANDVSGNGFHGTLQNGTTFTNDRFNNPNSAAYFDGLDDFIEVIHDGSLSRRSGFSFVVQFRTEDIVKVQTLIERRDRVTEANSQFQAFINWSNHPGFGYGHHYTNNADCNNVISVYNLYVNTGPNTIQLNQWHCVVGTFDGINQKIYLDGVLMETLATPLPLMDSCVNIPMLMGRHTNSYLQAFQGAMDEVRIYNRPLNQDEVNALCQTTVLADFSIPDTVCVNTPVTITNTSTNATTYYWNFCSGSLNSIPAGTNFTSPNLSMPVFMDIVQEGTNFYVFVVNHTGSLARMSFGNSLLNTPVITDLGSFGGIIPWQAEGIEIKKDGNNWIGYIIGGQFANSRLLKLNFGTSVANIPVATNLGNVGGLDYPVDFTLIEDGANWYGLTVSADNNTVTRYDFGNSLNNAPVAVNLGNIGGLNYPVGVFLVKDGNNYHVFITNRNSNSISRLDFGTSIANTPTGLNLGNPGSNFNWPRDITVIRDCDKVFGFVTNEATNAVTRLDFNNNLLSVPATSNLGNIGALNFPSSISEIFRTGDAVNFFAPNVNSNSVSRLTFNNCTNSSIPSHSGPTPLPVQYSQPGTYNISLFIDEGLSTQSSICKQIVVIGKPDIDFNYQLNVCNPLSVQFNGIGTDTQNPYWSFGDATTNTGNLSPVHVYPSQNNYTVSYTAGTNASCPDTVVKTISLSVVPDDIIRTADTTICLGTTKQLLTQPALSFCWTPTTYLNDPASANPITSTPQNITYYYTAEVTGNNLIVNGDFSQGNTGFSSEYSYTPPPNLTEAQYYVGTSPQVWNGGLNPCGDHTSGNANMMMINGSPVPDVNVWRQTVNVTPNTNYAFSTWIQALGAPNPAQLKFSINNKDIGTLITASLPACTWTQFYTTWNSGNNTTAIISIVNKNTAVQGNDFALDDISFAPVFIKRDSVRITVDTPYVRTNDDVAVCEGIPVQLNTTGATTYSWTPSAGLSSTTIANPVATPATTTQYVVTGINANGCTEDDSVTITISPKPVITITPATTICRNTTIQLSATGGGTYAWTPPATLSDPAIANPVASPAGNTKYYVTVTGANTCTNIDSVTISIHPDPVFTISNPATICDKETIQLLASGGDSYTWQPDPSLTSTNIANPVATPSATTTYSVLITESTCNNSATLQTTVTVNPLPDVQATSSNDIDCSNDRSQLNATGAATYIWTPSATLSNSGIANPVATPASNTKYIVEGTDINGCVNYDSVVVNFLAINASGYHMPNAFTPNGDGLNDCYGIRYWGVIQELEFSIYNRWGERIFFTKDPDACWDGTYKGEAQDTGVYVFMIKAKTLCGDTFKKGLFTLVR